MSFDDYVAKKAALDEAEARLRALQDEARAQAEENSRPRSVHADAERGLLDAAFAECAAPPAPPPPPKKGFPRGVRGAAAERGPAGGAVMSISCVSCDGGPRVHPLPAMAAVTRALLASVSYSTLAAIH